MRTVILGEAPQEIRALIESRRSTGADLYDEVWEGDYHMAPAPRGAHGALDGEFSAILRPHAKRLGMVDSGPFNLGEPGDFRVPDRGIREPANLAWYATALLVVEIVSPYDESWEKLDFYAARDVDEVVIADSADRSVTWLRLTDGRYEVSGRSRVCDTLVADLVAQIDWPPLD